MSRKIFALLPVLIFVTVACNKEDNQLVIEAEPEVVEEVGFPNVEEPLWIYFARYEEEAQRRGVAIDLRNAQITGMIESIEDDGVAGQCSYSSAAPNHVTIDLEFWNRASDRAREFVVFHELGHCHLARGHREDAFVNGACQSIMRSGLGTCRDNYTTINRTSYLDELFDPQFRNTIGQ